MFVDQARVMVLMWLGRLCRRAAESSMARQKNGRTAFGESVDEKLEWWDSTRRTTYHTRVALGLVQHEQGRGRLRTRPLERLHAATQDRIHACDNAMLGCPGDCVARDMGLNHAQGRE